jgi:dolichyl-phosphate beta-glucosyltransferase
MPDSLVVVVPCYNEESRLRPDGFAELVRGGKGRILFVDDGSTDATYDVLQGICRDLRFASILRLEENQGKAEAVRRGLLQAVEWPASFVGYLDADLATPAHEMVRVVDALRRSDAQVAMGCRLRLRGAAIARNARRRLLGQSFSLAASAVLGARFRDTQCGAKAFRVSRALHAALGQRFHARWAFDVELLGRLLTGMHASLSLPQDDFLEVPLQSWHEVPGSKLRPRDIPLLGLELLRIAWELARLRMAVRSPAPLPLSVTAEELEDSAPARVAGAG